MAYRALTHETTGATPVSTVFESEHLLPFEILFGTPPDKEQAATDYMVDLIDRLHSIHLYAVHN